MEILTRIWSSPRSVKRIVSLLIDAFLIIFSFYFSYWLRLGEFTFDLADDVMKTLFFTILISLFTFVRLGLYRAVIRYFTSHTLSVVALGAFVSASSISIFSFYFEAEVPRTVPLIYLTILCVLVGGARLTVRSLIFHSGHRMRESVLIYGAGVTGRQLAIALWQADSYQVRGFVDNDRSLQKTLIQGLCVYHPTQLENLVSTYNIKKILLAVPSVSRSERKEIIDYLLRFRVDVLTVPDFDDIIEGKANIDQLKDVAIEDLLGREPVIPDPKLMKDNITDKVVMVTGAGGSIGSELCRQIVKQSPRCLVLFELSEFALYQIDQELTLLLETEYPDVEIVPLMGSVQRFNRLSHTMKAFGVQTVYHAAAYKHVPLVEYNVVEGVRNNVFGSYYCAQAAIDSGVESFVLISTDKAVRPTNIMGATKRMAEIALQSLAEQEKKKEKGTLFSMVRFGNVLGSSGSVIPLFKRQIAEGRPVTVTHPDIIRYFMTIPEAAQLVIQASAIAKGGDVFVLDMGNPVKIVDLARNLIQLSGLDVKDELNPNGDIEIEYTGLRPGEKLYEELLIGNNVEGTIHPRIMTAKEKYLSWGEFSDVLEQLDNACHSFNHEEIRQILINAHTGFEPTDGIGDLVWNAKKDNNLFGKNNIVDLKNSSNVTISL